ncbi:hypothetical protein SDRG_07043 [Saprolegnia diclina VS20]|uniref:Rrn7/TAF1B N-terminal cyclin domain-containing protein n=1 Tax=Saprolegnia diclina (strain VS20) TaxID=1156394 RepID=T0QKU0_SAPDV|nr:hypothetical protein SDRG_07043 [Saprolegnia diclina VS20]EQC35331.1 hypothetical protein SDRG_07043 [Saprolegnia diclina VS20]|eukprot:XP_008611081.1 hypothetical protein SDRG_07043 [Saprolegnia diclina VS20]
MSQFTYFCTTCGVTGEDNFDRNDATGESICNICGAQNAQQSRNEEYDMEDALAMRGSRKIRQKAKRARRGKAAKEARPLVTLESCLHVSQTILHLQAEALAVALNDPGLVATVEELWFHFLGMWSAHGTRPLLNCFLSKAGHASDKPANALLESGYETQWDYGNDGKGAKETELSRFSLRSHLGLLYLAARLRHLGVLTSDLYVLVRDGRLPYGNVLSLLPDAMTAPVDALHLYFNTNLPYLAVTASTITAEANYLHYHLDLELPPLNMSLAFRTCAAALQLPNAVSEAFSILQTVLPPETMAAEGSGTKLWLLPSEVDFVARVLVALKLCPSWHLLVYTSNTDKDEAFSLMFPLDARAPRLKRKHLHAFVAATDDARHGQWSRVTVPSHLDDHIEALQTIAADETVETLVKPAPVVAFAPMHNATGAPVDQVPTTPDDAPFYPYYRYPREVRLQHVDGATEHLVSVLAEYMDMPRLVVFEAVATLEKLYLPLTDVVPPTVFR